MPDAKKIMASTFFRYNVLGVSSLLLKYLLSITLTEYIGLWYFYSYLISLVIIIIFNFTIAYFYVFRTQGAAMKRFLKYLVSVILFSAVDALAVKFFTDTLSLYYPISISISVLLIYAVKYLFYKRLVFNADEL